MRGYTEHFFFCFFATSGGPIHPELYGGSKLCNEVFFHMLYTEKDNDKALDMKLKIF